MVLNLYCLVSDWEIHAGVWVQIKHVPSWLYPPHFWAIWIELLFCSMDLLIVKLTANNIFLIAVFIPYRNTYGIHTLNKWKPFLYRRLREDMYKTKTTDGHIKVTVILNYIRIISTNWYICATISKSRLWRPVKSKLSCNIRQTKCENILETQTGLELSSHYDTQTLKCRRGIKNILT